MGDGPDDLGDLGSFEDPEERRRARSEPPSDLTPIHPADLPPDPPSPGERRKQLLRRVLLGGSAAALAGAIGLLLTFLYVSRDLPTLHSLNDYHPKQATVVYGKDGQVVARFATERRTLVPYDGIPQVMIDAVTSAEDADFFNHGGVDYVGILRCAVINTISMRARCGGSTITQQMVKTFLLTPEKKLIRKLKEIILTKRVEDRLSKQEILYLYLNQIYFGHGAYGIEEAARVYFGKDIDRLTIEEAALLGGIPQSPARLDPFRHPERAAKRRAYVLGQMHHLHKIDDATYQHALATPIRVDWRQADDAAVDTHTYYAAQVRKQLEDLVGVERATDGGLKVYTGIDPGMQRTAERTLRDGLEALDKRQGYRGPLLHLEADELKSLGEMLKARSSSVSTTIAELDEAKEQNGYAPVIWDLSHVTVRRDSANRLNLSAVLEEVRFRRLQVEQTYGGLVVQLDESGKNAIVQLGPEVFVTLPLRTGLAWARKFNIHQLTARPKTPSEVLAKGDVVLVRPTSIGKKHPKPAPTAAGDEPLAIGNGPEILGALEQVPLAQSAFVVIDPATRQVRAMVGGYGEGAGTFDRATQAKRQAGSTFKPFVYGTALESGKFTTISTCMDAPQVYRDPWTGQAWKPQNYDEHFDGEITLRTALTKSKNLCSVWLIHELGVDKVMDFARRAGIKADLPRSDTLALGSGSVTPIEMVNAYATLATGGQYADPIFIRKVVDPDGKILFEAPFQPQETLAPQVVYLVTSLMQSVVEDGTAKAVSVLGRPIAGKTGTTNESRDAWFIGFTPDIVAGVWVGFDNNDPLGPGETGGKAAIPIWLDFMKEHLPPMPVRDFVPPNGITFAYVDPKSGRLAPPETAGSRYEPFVTGTEPTDLMTNAKPPVNFGIDDFEN